ncbi:MAG: NAD(+) synthase [Lachnospiraceae bacterium]|nr:NAD(+) synthase [Lachnospiraceae bacterium]
MKDGYIKCAAVATDVHVADTVYNSDRIIEKIRDCVNRRAGIIVFPELCITGYTCQDLFHQESLLNGALEGLKKITDATAGKPGLVFVGLPYRFNSKLYNVAAAISDGEVLALIPKMYMPNYNEFYEVRHFTPWTDENRETVLFNKRITIGNSVILKASGNPDIRVSAELCEDLWVPVNPATYHCRCGANIIVNLSASNELTGKSEYRRQLVASASARMICGYVYASAGIGESTQDLVFGGHHIIAENGTVLSEAKRFTNDIIMNDIDVQRLIHDRSKMTTYDCENDESYLEIEFNLPMMEVCLDRTYAATPFVPKDTSDRKRRCEEIFSIQAYGLRKRIDHTGTKSLVVGLSGGLDSTLALLVAVKALDIAGRDRKDMIAVTMPCFGTTDRTYNNAIKLAAALGVTLKEIRINESVISHFKDIEHDMDAHDVTYENGQARERTQILMDLANKYNGMVVGTGDMSELALGWATYNGDHMSMYGVNAGVPKTLVRHLVDYSADVAEDETLREVLRDVLDTPVSPELLPPENGKISQKTENIVGPYELHDFFMYHMLRDGMGPAKIYRIALKTFDGSYEPEEILKWEKVFVRRFFAQQFKRSCLPDGPKVGSVAVSPRGDLRMPSDACATVWLKELDSIG